MIAPDTTQNIGEMVKLLVGHNFLAIIFLGGVLASTAYSLWKPTRGAILFIIGFALLLFAFEYEKHIADALIEQTKGSLITERQSYRLEWLLNKILGKAATPLLYLTGIASLGLGGFLLLKEKKSR